VVFEFDRSRIDKIPKERIIEELRRVAELFNYRKFGWREFDEVSKLCKSYCVKRNFDGSWKKALDSIGIPLAEKSRRKFFDYHLFMEMERVWKLLGHRPSRIEWETSQPKISYSTYKKYFGGWVQTCLKFIEYKMGGDIMLGDDTDTTHTVAAREESKPTRIKKRDVPLRLRLKVLSRDSFKCVFCGRSPALHPGVVLHIDHVLPVAKGGATKLDNLQTLCRECNLGKGQEA